MGILARCEVLEGGLEIVEDDALAAEDHELARPVLGHGAAHQGGDFPVPHCLAEISASPLVVLG